MAVRGIVKDGDPVLLKKSRPVVNFDERLATLLSDMGETMNMADGLGLAGPQVGILRRVVVVLDDNNEVLELVNPEIISQEGEFERSEGCLSFPNTWCLVKRPTKVTVRAQDRNGKFFEVTGEGMLARCFCHEVDHLDGVVFTARATRHLTKEEVRRLQNEG